MATVATRDELSGAVGDGLLAPPGRTSRRAHLIAVTVYLALALVLWAHVWFGGDPAQAITCNCGDTVQQVWWFEWLPWAVLHGHNPFLTNALWARFGGVNALSNTSWFAPAAVLSPVTLLFGPVASVNLANLLAPVVSGWAAFMLAGRFSRRTVARLVAGGLYAFSPFVLRNTVIGHIGLTFSAYLPLLLLFGLRLLSREARPVRIGLWLGVATILEFFTGLEVLALTAITGVLCVAGVAIARPTLLRAAGRGLVTAALLGGSLAAVVLAYPVWFYVAGPRHVVGPFWPVASSAPGKILRAGPDVFNAHTGLTVVGYLGNQGPNTDYLGFGLLLAVALSAPWWMRRRSGAVIAGVGLLSWAFEFVPARAWAKLPFLSSIEPVRFALPVSLCVGLLLAVSIDAWWSAIARRWPGSHQLWRRRGAVTALLLATVAAFIPLVDEYSLPFHISVATVPSWFSHDAPRLPSTTAVLTIPVAYDLASRPMGWQAETDDEFNLFGGWAFVPGADITRDEMISPLGGVVGALRALSDDPRHVTSAEQMTIRDALARWLPLVVVIVPAYAKPGSATAMTDTLGITATAQDGAWVWVLRRGIHFGPMAEVTGDHAPTA